jgi:hypothetical protein
LQWLLIDGVYASVVSLVNRVIIELSLLMTKNKVGIMIFVVVVVIVAFDVDW